jgi:hypothetical protein
MNELIQYGDYTLSSWASKEVQALYSALEEPNWAPWLSASPETLAARADVFPEGQLVMKDPSGAYIGSLSLNQIMWDGKPNHLPSWDEVAGDPTDYSTTYNPHGNTLVLLSMNVSPEWKGKHVPSKLIINAKKLAFKLGIAHIMGSFRPSGYGEAKQQMGFDLDFAAYCNMTRQDSSKPIDPWLGSLWHMGMHMVAIDKNAMIVSVPMDEFLGFKQTYKPNVWKEIVPGTWECGEVGVWKVDEQMQSATYKESNVWGSLPLLKLSSR